MFPLGDRLRPRKSSNGVIRGWKSSCLAPLARGKRQVFSGYGVFLNEAARAIRFNGPGHRFLGKPNTCFTQWTLPSHQLTWKCTDPSTKTTFLLVSWPFCTSMLVGRASRLGAHEAWPEAVASLRSAGEQLGEEQLTRRLKARWDQMTGPEADAGLASGAAKAGWKDEKQLWAVQRPEVGCFCQGSFYPTNPVSFSGSRRLATLWLNH